MPGMTETAPAFAPGGSRSRRASLQQEDGPLREAGARAGRVALRRHEIQVLVSFVQCSTSSCLISSFFGIEVPSRATSTHGDLSPEAAPWVKPWSATPGQNIPQNAVSNRPYSGCNVILLWLARNRGWATPRFLTFKQALDAGGNVRKGEHGTKVYFVKQLQIKDGDGEEDEARLIPMMREYTVFNVDQCENLPDRLKIGKPLRVRNPDTRDGLADEFLPAT